ncbi:MAG: ribosomal RNA small subunit methyltransferase A [Kiritimatiellae bacterium]|nr:ribosomal RNA small subunit methyltransferase A [Kiritimatiellia bacterium]
MNLTSPSQVKAWCIANGFHPNKVLGQNFLVDRNALEAIVDAATLPAGTRVLEIGPGLGVLTEEMLRRGLLVTAVEKDLVLAERLAEALGNPPGLDVRAGDALDLIKDGSCDGFPALVSNLPYQAGTRILLELVQRIGVSRTGGAALVAAQDAPETIVVLVQTEVAERLAAGPGSKTRGLAGVWVQLDYDVQLVRAVKASCFWPRPEIGSTVVRLTRHHHNDARTPDWRARFRQITKQAFEHRRKQLGAIFKGAVQSTARAEQLSNADWLAFVTQCLTV